MTMETLSYGRLKNKNKNEKELRVYPKIEHMEEAHLGGTFKNTVQIMHKLTDKCQNEIC